MKLKMENKMLTNFSISSLTDIVMLLLIFFLLSSSFVTSSGIKVQLPRAETGEAVDDQNITLSLTEKGHLYVNSERVTLNTLGAKLSAAMNNDHNKVIVVSADKSVTLQSTVQVIDIAKSIGANRFLIATQRSSSQ